MSKELDDIARKFKKDMQKIADKGDLTISVSVGNGEYHTIAEPKNKVDQQSSETLNKSTTMSEKHSTKQCKVFLRYDFKHEEIHEMGADLARVSSEVARIKEEKKATVTQYNAKIAEKEAEIGVLGNNINNGHEYRNIDCIVHFNQPNTGKKTTYRLDTSEQVRVENMTAEEMQMDLEFEDLSGGRVVPMPDREQE